MTTPTLEEVAIWLSSELSVNQERIRATTLVEDDLGCTGDDARDLMAAFSRDFRVDLAGFDFRQHFGPEIAATPWSMADCLFLWVTTGRAGESSPDPITVERLATIAVRGRWVEAEGTGN